MTKEKISDGPKIMGMNGKKGDISYALTRLRVLQL